MPNRIGVIGCRAVCSGTPAHAEQVASDARVYPDYHGWDLSVESNLP